MNEQENRQLMPVLLPRNEEEQVALSATFAHTRNLFSSDDREDKFIKPVSSLVSLQEGPCLTLIRESAIPDSEKNKEETETRRIINDKDRVRGFPTKILVFGGTKKTEKKRPLYEYEDIGTGKHILGDDVLNLEVLKKLKPYFSSTLNQNGLNGLLGRYLTSALSFYLPDTSWKNVLGNDRPHFARQRAKLEILLLGENQFQLTFTQLGFNKYIETEEYSDTEFAISLNLTFGSEEDEMPSDVTLSNVTLTPFSPELSKAIDAQKVLERKLSDILFITTKLSDPTYCHLITTLIFLGKINLDKLLHKATSQQKINLLKNIFGRQEFSEWFEQLPKLEQDYLLDKTRALPLSEKVKIYTQSTDKTVKEAFAQNIGWNATTQNIHELTDQALKKVVLLDRDPHLRILKKIIEDANKPIESYNFFEKRFPKLFQKKRKQNQDIIEKKYALRLLLSTKLSPEDSALKETFDYLTNKDSKNTLAEAFLSNLTLLDMLKFYQSANDLLKTEIPGPIKNSEAFRTASVSDLLQAGATAKELTTFAKLKSGESLEVTLNETTEAIIKGAGKQIKPLNFFERNFPRIFKRKARENKETEIQKRAFSALMFSDKTLVKKVQEKIDSLNTPWSEKFLFVDALPKSADYIELLKSQAKIFFDQALPKEDFIANAATYTKLAQMLPVGFEEMNADDIKEGNTPAGIHKFFSGQYTFLCLPLDSLPTKEDFENDASIQACCDMVAKRIQQIKELLGSLAFFSTLENSTADAKQKIVDSALQNEARRSELVNLAFLPNDPYGVRPYLEEKNTFTFEPLVPKFEMPPFVRQEIPAVAEDPIPAPIQRSSSASKIVAATMGDGTPELLRTSTESSPRSFDSEELEDDLDKVVQTTPVELKLSSAQKAKQRAEDIEKKVAGESKIQEQGARRQLRMGATVE